MISVADLIRHRLRHERIIARTAEGVLRTPQGEFRTVSYRTSIDNESHLALVRGDIAGEEPVLTRMHAHCLYGDVFGSTDCDCQRLIALSLERIAARGRGVLVYLHQNGPGIGLQTDPSGIARMVSHTREFRHYSTPNGQRMLQHEFGVGAQILNELGVRNAILLTNHPRKVVGLEAFGIRIVEQTPIS
jgi:3,4-dihydroxy 2-butanone 4-phosphate synthase/GTP cyclohydrolase II